MRICICLLLLTSCVQAQQTATAVRVAMQQSLLKQRESIERQRASVRETGRLPVLPAVAPPAGCDALEPEKLDGLIAETAYRQQVDPTLIREVARQESGFHPCAVSSKGALGLMQLMPATAEELGVRDPFDIRENLSGGSRFLKQLIDRYAGDIRLALGAYNAGPGRVDRIRAIPPIPETQHYVTDILSRLPQN